jgi:CheY-like chemotaxis protein
MTQEVKNPIRVLYIEDEKTLQDVISQMLELLGYEVACASNGKVGVEMAKDWQPDLILTDLRMPVMDGPEAIRTLRHDTDTTNIPIFVLSAYSDSKTRETCRQAGADDFFTKPPDIEKIDAAIKRTVSGRK